MATPFDLGLVDGNVWSAAHVNSIEAAINGLKDVTNADLLAALSSRYMPIPGAGCRLVSTANQSIPINGADITWATETDDADGWHAPGSATLICPTGKGGVYTVTYTQTFAGAPGTLPGALGFLNGVIRYGAWGEALAVGSFITHTLCYRRLFVAGDTIKFMAHQNSAGAVALNAWLEVLP